MRNKDAYIKVTLIGGPGAGRVVEVCKTLGFYNVNATRRNDFTPDPLPYQRETKLVRYKITPTQDMDGTVLYLGLCDRAEDPMAQILATYSAQQEALKAAVKQGRIEGLKHARALTAGHFGSGALIRESLNNTIQDMEKK